MGRLERLGRGDGNRHTADAGAGGGWNKLRSGSRQSADLWDAAFKKKPRLSDIAPPPDHPPGGQGSLITPGQASVERLVRALRSNAPGNWTDDRYEQTLKHYTGAPYVAIHRKSVQLQRAEFQVFREDPGHPDGRRPVTRDDPAYELVNLLKRPNRHDTFGKMMHRWSIQKNLTGTAFTWKRMNVLGKPFELWPLPTAICIPQGANSVQYPDGYFRVQPVYPYGPFSTWPSPTSSVGAALDSRDMIKFQNPHPLLRYEGYSPLTALNTHIDCIQMIDRARHYLMRRGMFPNAVLNSSDVEGTEELDEDDVNRLRAMFEEDHMGPENFGRLFVAYAGYKLEKWGDPPSEMAFEQGWDQLCSFILGGGFGITKPAAGMVEDSSYQTLFATLKQLHLCTLDPECEEIGAELTREIGHYWGEDVIIHVRMPRVDDHEVRFTGIDKAVNGKCMTKNELRRHLSEAGLDLPPTEEEWGKEFAGAEPQQEQPMQPGMPGAPQEGAMEQQADPMAALADLAGGADEEQAGPGTGTLGANSQGPKPGSQVQQAKRFTFPKKSLYSLGMEVMCNGTH